MTEAKTTPKKSPKTTAPKKTEDKSSYAVFTTGGKQYLVSPGKTIKIEKLQGEYKEGDSIYFDKVLLLNNGETTVGAPFIKDGKIDDTLTKIGRYKTIDVIKYKQKSRYF